MICKHCRKAADGRSRNGAEWSAAMHKGCVGKGCVCQHRVKEKK